MTVSSQTAAADLAALVCASGASVALGLIALPHPLAAGLAVACAGLGLLRLGPAALGAALPAVALLGDGSWVALAGWTAAGLAASVGFAEVRAERRRTALKDLHDELRDGAHERAMLERNIQRYPVLLEACLELSAAKELDQLADVLCARARALVPESREILVFLGTLSDQACRAASTADGRDRVRDPGPDELYVATESRSLTRREGDLLRVLIPLRSDRRQGDSSEALRGVLEVALEFSEVGERMSLELLHALGRLGGLGLAAVDLVNQARGLALHDDLTGLYGQHEFLRRLDEQVSHSRRYSHPLGVVMCDMDRLKKFNDTWGHAAGDDALRAVAKSITASLPPGTIPCRYGGEEFAVLVPGLEERELRAVCEYLRGGIEKSQPDPEHPDRRVTASIGYAMVRKEESGRDALRRADQACYRAKAGGRNRVEAAT